MAIMNRQPSQRADVGFLAAGLDRIGVLVLLIMNLR